MKVLMVGDIVGSPGRNVFGQVVAKMKGLNEADFVVANAENTAGGRGLTAGLAEELFSMGADVLTLGDHTWDRKEFLPYLDKEKRVVRPLNFAPGCPGHGFTTLDTGWGAVTVVNLIGRVFMKAYDCPFRAIDQLLGKITSKMILVDMHAEATSEKIAIGRYLNGRVSCVVGTHTHVQTSDEAVLEKGTAYITDLGMAGAKDSVIGRGVESVTDMFLTGMPAKFDLGRSDVMLEGVVVDIDRETGKALSIKRIREPLQKEMQGDIERE